MSAFDTTPLAKKPGAIRAWFGRLKARSSRGKGLSGRPPRRFISVLFSQILIFNLIALVFFVGGVYWVQTVRVSLVDERVKSLMGQAEIVAAALAKYAAKGPEGEEDAATDVDPERTSEVLKLLVGPTRMRARIFSRNGAPVNDTRFILTRNQVQSVDLPPPGALDVVGELERNARSVLYAMRPGSERPPVINDEGLQPGRNYEEVRTVLDKGEPGSAERINSAGNLIVSVAVPIKRLQFIMGVLMISTEAGDIDDALRAEWLQLMLAAILAFVSLGAASVFLFIFITRPIQTLAAGSEAVRRGERSLSVIPNLGRRGDEIGDLSVSLRSMTAALYTRMDAIEQFAADVAHEIKNPLTSVASAIETLQRSTNEEQRAKLMGVVRDDIRRLDRLITDISDASRLDAELSREKSRNVDVAGLVSTLAEMFGQLENAPRFVIDVPSDGLLVRGLDGPFAQVFRNVIENAMSFSPKGGEIKVSGRGVGGAAVITIEDQGPGIPEENLDTIFKRFYTERPTSHGFGKNSGLGLSISRQIVEVFGGRIFAHNIRGADGQVSGARFTIELPLSPIG